MTPRERAIKAFALEEPDRVPLWEAYITNDLVYEKFTGQRLMSSPTPNRLAQHEKRERMARINAKRKLLCYRRLGLDMSPVVGVEAPIGWRPRRIGERTWIGETGATWRNGFVIDHPIKAPEDVEDYIYPDPHAPGRMDHARIMVEEANKYDMLTVAEVGGGLEYTIVHTIPLPKLVVFMYRYPFLAKRVINMVVDFSIEVGKALIDMGVPVILISNDSGYKAGPMISPKLFHEFISPTFNRQVNVFKKRGATAVILHCDGNVYPLLDDMVDSGIDGWHAIEPVAGMNLKHVKEKYGDRICLLGNIDVSHTLPFGSPQQVAGEVKECLEAAAPGGGYFLGSSNSIHDGIPPSNVVAMFEAGRKYGKYPITP